MSTSILTTESEALRKLNLPSTPRWREWLRSKLDPVAVGGGFVYESGTVRSLARKVADFAAATAEHAEQPDPPPAAPAPAPVRMATSAPAPLRHTAEKLHDRNGPAVR